MARTGLLSEQQRRLQDILDRIAASVSTEPGELRFAPFNQWGGIFVVHTVFGDDLQEIIDQLNPELVR